MIPGIFQLSAPLPKRGKVIFQTNPLADWGSQYLLVTSTCFLHNLSKMLAGSAGHGAGVLVGWDNDACFLGVWSRCHVEILETAMYQQIKHLRSNVNNTSWDTVIVVILMAILCGLFRITKCPFPRLSDLQIKGKSHGLTHLVQILKRVLLGSYGRFVTHIPVALLSFRSILEYTPRHFKYQLFCQEL